jgi:DNA-binding XRE family transcriptional regulator
VNKNEFKKYRKRLNKTQKQMAELLGTSLKAIHSYEQGWQLFFLVSRLLKKGKGTRPCWTVKKCSARQRSQCPAWEFGAGDFCWLINGTVCDGTAHRDWNEKMKICRSCEVFSYIL